MNLKSCVRTETFLPLLIVAATFCPLICGQQSGSRSAAEAKALLDDIGSKGAGAVVGNLNSGNGSQWKNVIGKIESGSPAWLDVAKKLLTATDAGRTSDLYFALSIALTRNAAGVLSMVGSDLPVDRVCSVPYIEPDEKTIRTHRIRVRTALQKVTSPELDSKKRACLNAVEQ